jgi:hypothetical protein
MVRGERERESEIELIQHSNSVPAVVTYGENMYAN